jgi:single stranded DNA-binding protein
MPYGVVLVIVYQSILFNIFRTGVHMSYANTIVVGNLGSDPEIHEFESGRTVTNFSLAVNRSWKDSDGNKHEETDWFECRAWNGAGKALFKYKKKGEPIVVDGRLDIKPAKDEDGEILGRNAKWVTLICRSVKFVNYPKNGTGNFDMPEEIDENEEEIPF